MTISRLKAAFESLLLITGTFLLAFYLGFLSIYFLLLNYRGLIRDVFAQEIVNCSTNPDGTDASEPFGDDFEPDLPFGAIITSLFINAGGNCFGPYTEDGTYEDDTDGENSCYGIEGLGSSQITVSHDGESEGEVCPEITQIEVFWELPLTPTPGLSISPTPSPEPTTTVTPSPEPSVTPAETISPTLTQSPTESPTPTLTTTPTITTTPTPEPSVTTSTTPTPTGQVQGSSTTNSSTDSSDTTSSQGQVLGTSTLAATGYSEKILAFIGVLLITLSAYVGGYKLLFKK